MLGVDVEYKEERRPPTAKDNGKKSSRVSNTTSGEKQLNFSADYPHGLKRIRGDYFLETIVSTRVAVGAP